MSPLLTDAILGKACGLSLLVLRRMPFLRRPSVDERISPYLGDLAAAPAPVESGPPFYAVEQPMLRIGRLPQPERELR